MHREGGLLAWQWRNYPASHRDRLSLMLHIVGVPAFIAGIMAAINLGWHGFWPGAGFALLVAALGYALQGIGHNRERVQPEPFAGPGDFLARLIVEQLITFPRFVLSGGWLRNLAQPDSD